jgi:hypothetical protein
VKNLGRETGGLELVGDGSGEATVVFNDDHQWLLLGAHAESGLGKTEGVNTYVKIGRELPSH